MPVLTRIFMTSSLRVFALGLFLYAILGFMKLPRRPLKPCKRAQFYNLTEYRFCKKHKKLFDRKGASMRVYDYRWGKARRRNLKANLLCAECLKSDRVFESIVVDHIIPHREDKKLF